MKHILITIFFLLKAPKLRHSFVGLLPENGKPRRPNSLISECSMSSGTSSSSISTGGSLSSGGGKNSTNCNNGNSNNNNTVGGLELINETQTLMLVGSGNGGNGIVTNQMSFSRNHKRSTTLVSQLSMGKFIYLYNKGIIQLNIYISTESGIISDISMTPDTETQEPTWPLMRKHSNISNSSSAVSSNECSLNLKLDVGHHHYQHNIHRKDITKEQLNNVKDSYTNSDSSIAVRL